MGVEYRDNAEMGSSPRGRGKHKLITAFSKPRGLIPAWAGKTSVMTTHGGWRRAHPRVGGGNALRRRRPLHEGGSSPRGRGKRRVEFLLDQGRGLIPAWAGKTRLTQSWACSRTAHPRVGGENLQDIFDLVSAAWLIPAWAGKTFVLIDDKMARTAHPRVGGENRRKRITTWMHWGSSPRGRGKRGYRRVGRDPEGLIPAWAGKTWSPHTTPEPRWAHPRVGGENLLVARSLLSGMGSSPRGRGKRLNRCFAQLVHGLIPAWAGKTPQRLDHVLPEGAHPRVGGENVTEALDLAGERGSSPRGRGKHRPRQAGHA